MSKINYSGMPISQTLNLPPIIKVVYLPLSHDIISLILRWSRVARVTHSLLPKSDQGKTSVNMICLLYVLHFLRALLLAVDIPQGALTS